MPMYQPEIETMPQDQLRALQSERLVKQVRHVYDNVPYYRAKMDEKGVTPDDIHGIEDLHKLPFVSKADLRECYPYGLLAKPLSECVRIHSTSGTTGQPRGGLLHPARRRPVGGLLRPRHHGRRRHQGRCVSTSPMATASSPAAPACTAAPTRSAA